MPRLLAALGLAAAALSMSASPPAATESQPPPSVAGAYLAGNFALGQGDLEEAAAGLRRALAAARDDEALRYQVMVLQVASGDLAGAAELLPPLLAASDDHRAGEARLVAAIAALREDAPAPLQHLAGIDPRSVPGLVRPVLEAWADPDPAAAAARLAATEGGIANLLAFHRVMLLDRAGAVEAGLAAIAALETEPSELGDRFLVSQARLLALAGEPDAARAILRLGRSPAARSEIVVRAGDALEAGAVPPALITDAATGMADALLGVGEVLHARQRPLHATFYTRLALALAPDYAPGHLLLASLLHEQEGAAAALAALDAIPSTSTWSRTAELRRAELLGELDEVDRGEAVLRDLLKADPRDVRAAIALGDLLRRAERFDAAAGAYATALERSDGGGDELWRLHYAHGIALERSRRWPEAEAALRRALDLEPEQPFVLNYLGYSWVDQGLHLDEARAMLYRAVELRPDDGFIVDSLGWAYYRLGDYEEAVRHLERAVELEPGDPVINDHLGDAYWRVGRHREARFQWQRALTLEPEPEAVASIEDKLEQGLDRQDRG